MLAFVLEDPSLFGLSGSDLLHRHVRLITCLARRRFFNHGIMIKIVQLLSSKSPWFRTLCLLALFLGSLFSVALAATQNRSSGNTSRPILVEAKQVLEEIQASKRSWPVDPNRIANSAFKPLIALSKESQHIADDEAEAGERSDIVRVSAEPKGAVMRPSQNYEEYTVQVAALGSQEAAKRFVNRLVNQDFMAYFYRIKIRGKTYYRVRCGKFKTRAEADDHRRELLVSTGLKGFVTREERSALASDESEGFSVDKSYEAPAPKTQKVAAIPHTGAEKMPEASGIPRPIQSPCFLTDGDVVIFYGDSVTAQRRYCQMVAGAYCAAAHKYELKSNVKFRTMGYTGKTAKWALANIGDVIVAKPTVVTLMWGTQDAWQHAYPSAYFLQEYRSIITAQVRTLQKLGIRPVILTVAPVYERPTRNSKNRVLDAYAQVQREVALSTKAGLVDTRGALKLEAAKVKRLVHGDAVGYLMNEQGELNLVGHGIIAEAILEAWRIPR